MESLEASPEAVEAAAPAGKAMVSAEPLAEAALLFLKALFPLLLGMCRPY